MIISNITRKEKIIVVDDYSEAIVLESFFRKEDWAVKIDLVGNGLWQVVAVSEY